MTGMVGLTYADGRLELDGRPLEEVLSTTPAYLYSRSALRERIALMREHIPADMQIKFAVKSNPFAPLVSWLSEHIDAFDIASITELEIARPGGLPMSYSGPSKQPAELRAAIEAGVVVNLESLSEWSRLLQIASEQKSSPEVAIRVNPDFSISTSGMVMTGVASQFGIEHKEADTLLRTWPSQVRWCGLHYFGGSQCLDAQALSDFYLSVAEDALRLADRAGGLPALNVGLGLGIPYNERDTPVSISAVADALHAMAERILASHPDCTLQLETGRYLVGEAGLFVTRVIDVKRSHGETFVVCDGGLNAHLAATGNLGQVIPRNYPACFSPQGSGDSVALQVVGPLCTPLDRLARNFEAAVPKEGDLFCILQSGAYGASASPQGFLSRQGVVEALI